MNEWKYFSRLISTEPIDYSQIEFYILLANKSQNNSGQGLASEFVSNSSYQDAKYNPQQATSQIKSSDGIRESDKKQGNSKGVVSAKKYRIFDSEKI